MSPLHLCSDCAAPTPSATRREFLRTVSAAAAATALAGTTVRADEAPQSETLVKKLYDSLTPAQKEEVCFEWDYKDDRGILRTHVSNNWHITDVTKLNVASSFYTKDQQDLIEAIFFGLYNPDWKEKIKKQLQDDAGGYGGQQSIALFGTPGSGQFEFVMTGRHLTIRADGDTTPHVAFGGPIFYGHAASGFNEKVGHPGNVFWYQAQAANSVFQMLDGKQREKALIDQAPGESSVGFRNEIPGVPVSDLTADQKDHAKKVLGALLEPYRTADRDEVGKCLEKHGGLDQCRLAFYKSGDLGNDGEWDIWRLEGPTFVWHFRGTPHVHVWVNIADDPSLPLNARG